MKNFISAFKELKRRQDMGGYMGVAAKEDCVFDLYFGIDYHSCLLYTSLYSVKTRKAKVCRAVTPPVPL